MLFSTNINNNTFFPIIRFYKRLGYYFEKLLLVRLFMFHFVLFIITNVLVLVLVVLIGGLIPLFERKFLSLIQRRVGPVFVGFRGRLQFLADALKVLIKEYV